MAKIGNICRTKYRRKDRKAERERIEESLSLINV